MNDIKEIALRCRSLSVDKPYLSQMGMSVAGQFARLLSDKLQGTYHEHHVFSLWRSGLLRADLIEASSSLEIPGVVNVSSNGSSTYMDNRKLSPRDKGWGGSLAASRRSHLSAIRYRAWRFLRAAKLPRAIEGKLRPKPIPNPTFSTIDANAFFHPFRIYPVYIALKLTRAEPTEIQFLLWEKGLVRVAKTYRQILTRSTSQQSFVDAIELANCVSEICSALEPVTYNKIFNSIRWQFPESEKSIRSGISERKKVIAPILDVLGLDCINELRQKLCREAEIIDGNKRLHVLIRLMRRSERERLRSDIGLCMILLTMAEVLRRAAEQHFAAQLPEEDELGFGQWMPGARQILYGTERVSDVGKMDLVTFLQQMGINHGTKARCYVEGNTEAAALRYAFEPYDQIDIIDLAGQVVERRRKGLAFRDSLRRDISERIFSFVFVDGDVGFNLSVVQQAARQNEIVGAFFVSKPDFELENFSQEELLDVACEMADVLLTEKEREIFLASQANCSTSSAYLNSLRAFDTRFSRVAKTQTWGESLMKLAFSRNEDASQMDRPILRAVNLVAASLHVSYSLHQREFKTDAESGLPVKRGK